MSYTAVGHEAISAPGTQLEPQTEAAPAQPLLFQQLPRLLLAAAWSAASMLSTSATGSAQPHLFLQLPCLLLCLLEVALLLHPLDLALDLQRRAVLVNVQSNQESAVSVCAQPRLLMLYADVKPANSRRYRLQCPGLAAKQQKQGDPVEAGILSLTTLPHTVHAASVGADPANLTATTSRHQRSAGSRL